MMQTTRTRQRIIALTCATATVCDNLALFGTATPPHWSWINQGHRQSRMTAAERAHELLQKLLNAQKPQDK